MAVKFAYLLRAGCTFSFEDSYTGGQWNKASGYCGLSGESPTSDIC